MAAIKEYRCSNNPDPNKFARANEIKLEPRKDKEGNPMRDNEGRPIIDCYTREEVKIMELEELYGKAKEPTPTPPLMEASPPPYWKRTPTPPLMSP